MQTLRAKHNLFLIGIVWLLSAYGVAQVSVLTQHNDNGRTGQNLNETILNTSNVNANFGKLFFRTVDDYVYAQPLYFPNLEIQGQTRNVIYVATEGNSVYAFDADDPLASVPLWRVSLGAPVPCQDICQNPAPSGCAGQYWNDIGEEVGITSTPVIDPTTNTIYVVAKVKNSDSTYHFYLHALDLFTGADKFAGPVDITAPSSAPVPFVPLNQLQRPGLLLQNGVVYVAFGSAGDFLDWQGWVMAHDASTLQQLGFFVTTPSNIDFDSAAGTASFGESGGGGIFAAGQGLVGDSNNNVYFTTGNGPFDANTGGSDYGDSALKLSLNTPTLNLVDYFAPYNAYNGTQSLGYTNTDLGAGGQLLIPGTTLLVGGGKDGILRLIDSTNMGKFNAVSNNDVQEFQATSDWIMGSPVYWNGPLGQQIYLWASGDVMKAWQFNGSTFQTNPVSVGNINPPGGETDTSPVSVSANGSVAGTGILWAPTALSGTIEPGASGILHVLDASNVATELWNSELDSARDTVGNFAKFTPPTIANGKVYLPTFSGQIVVYGLNPSPAGIRFVQVASTSSPSGSQVSQGFSSPQTKGNLNIVVVSSGDTTSNVMSLTDSLGNSYILAVGPTVGTGVRQSIYYAKNIAAGSNTVTAKFNQTATYPEVRIFEYAGLDSASPLDVTAAGAGSGVVADSGPATTTVANELIFGANAVTTSNIMGGSPFIARLITSGGDLAEDRIVNVADAYDASSPINPPSPATGGNWVMQMATFKAQGSASGNFSLSASPSSASVGPSGSTSYTVSVTGVNGFSGPVSLACAGVPSGASCSFNPPSVSPDSSPATSTLTVTNNGVAANNYNLTITGSSASVSQNTSVSLTVQGSFSLSLPNPASMSVTAGSSATFTTTVTPSVGFSGNVTFNCTIVTSATPPPVCSSTAVTLSGAPVQATLTVSTTAPHASLSSSRSIFYAMLLPLVGMTLMGAAFPSSRKKKLVGLLLMLVLLSGLQFLAACGSSSSSSGGGGGGGLTGGTPAGTYIVTATGTSGSATAQTITFTLIVQ